MMHFTIQEEGVQLERKETLFFAAWSVEAYTNQKEILFWLKEISEQFPLEIAKNSFSWSGYFFEYTVDYSRHRESESDVES